MDGCECFSLLICLLEYYHRGKIHFEKRATNKGNIKIFAILLVPGGIFVMSRSGQGKWEEEKYFKKIEIQKTSNVF